MKTLFAAASMAVGGIAQAADITVLATPGIKEAYVELAPLFEKAEKHKVTTTWAGTNSIPAPRTASRCGRRSS